MLCGRTSFLCTRFPTIIPANDFLESLDSKFFFCGFFLRNYVRGYLLLLFFSMYRVSTESDYSKFFSNSKKNERILNSRLGGILLYLYQFKLLTYN